jgi:uncharacterized Zn finger protein (UPF0148 family)
MAKERKYDEAAWRSGEEYEIISLEYLIAIRDRSEYDKYDGQLFCPECHSTQLTLVNKDNHYHLRAYPRREHQEDCSYNLELVNSEIFTKYLESPDNKEDIIKRLNNIIRKLQKKSTGKNPFIVSVQNEQVISNNLESDDAKQLTKINYAIHHKSLTATFDEDDYGVLKIFYCNVLIEWIESDAGGYYLWFRNPSKNNVLLCSLKITQNVFAYFPSTIKNIPKSVVSMAYVAFIGKMYKSKNPNDSGYPDKEASLRYSYYLAIG